MTQVADIREQFLKLSACVGPYDSPHRCSNLHCDHCGLCDISEEVLALIQQKQLQARLDELNNVVLACEIDELSSLQPVGSYTKRRREEVKAQLSIPPKKEGDMNPIDLTLKLLEDTPHCEAELEQNRPIAHWQTHCVNCGTYMNKPHRRSDCPPQHYERTPHG